MCVLLLLLLLLLLEGWVNLDVRNLRFYAAATRPGVYETLDLHG